MLMQDGVNCKRNGCAICPRKVCPYHCRMSIYPAKIWQLAAKPRHQGIADGDCSRGRDASFVCGSFVGFSLVIDARGGEAAGIRFQTNGCGYMIAAADALCSAIEGKQLAELHGLAEDHLTRAVEKEIGRVPVDREQCVAACIGSLRSAFADHRARRLSEFAGEKALICTCFGVTEETIDESIVSMRLETVEAVTDACRAGGGCGSCRMLIQEMIDQHGRESVSQPR